MEGAISFWEYKEQESNLILPEHDDDDDDDDNEIFILVFNFQLFLQIFYALFTFLRFLQKEWFTTKMLLADYLVIN